MNLNYLFFCVDDEVQVFRLKDNMSIEPIPKNESYKIALDESFWSWWKKAADYEEGAVCDFCLIWHNSNEDKLLKNGLDIDETSEVWNCAAIEACFKIVFDGDYDVRLCTATDEFLHFKSAFASKKRLDLYTSLNLAEEVEGSTNAKDASSNESSTAPGTSKSESISYKEPTNFDIYWENYWKEKRKNKEN